MWGCVSCPSTQCLSSLGFESLTNSWQYLNPVIYRNVQLTHIKDDWLFASGRLRMTVSLAAAAWKLKANEGKIKGDKNHLKHLFLSSATHYLWDSPTAVFICHPSCPFWTVAFAKHNSVLFPEGLPLTSSHTPVCVETKDGWLVAGVLEEERGWGSREGTQIPMSYLFP